MMADIDISVGELPEASYFDDESILVVENQGQAQKVPGRMVKDFAAAGAEEAQEKAEEAAEKAAAAVVSPPTIGTNGNWYLWDFELGAYVDSGKPSAGSGTGGGAVQSVNGKTGTVVLGASDVGALPSGTKIPAKTSDLTNDSGFITGYTETDPTVPAWAKSATKPSYTAAEVGADPEGAAVGAVGEHNVDLDSHNDIRSLIEGLTSRLNALANSDDTTLDQMAEVVAYIKANRTLIESITTNKVSVTDIVDNLTTNVTSKPLSAAQGVALKKLIDAITVPTKLSQLTNDSGFITNYTETDPTVPAWAKAASKPSYTAEEVGALPKSTPIPSVVQSTGDSTSKVMSQAAVTKELNQLSNEKVDQADAVLSIPQTLTEAQKAQARANIGATAGEDVDFADSLDWLEENGDTTKKYVLPDGYIYIYTQKTETKTHNANDGKVQLNARTNATNALVKNSDGTFSSPGTTSSGAGNLLTGVVELKNKSNPYNVTISGISELVSNFYASLYVHYYKSDGTCLGYLANNGLGLTSAAEANIPLPVTFNLATGSYWSNATYVVFTLGIKPKNTSVSSADVEGLVINFERLDTEETVYGWYSTGQQHSNDKATQQNSADIATLKEEVATLKKVVSTSPSNSGAKWFAIGDSITYGLYSTSATDYHQPVVGQRWVDYVAKHNGYQLTNLGVSGSGFVTGTTFRTVVDRNDFSDVDLVTILLGGNDWKNEAAVNKVGTFDDDITTGGTIVSEFRYGLEKIIADNPYCKIIFITPINAKIGSRGTEETNWAYGYTGTITPCGSLKNFCDKLKEVCEYYGIQVIDMTNSSVVNRKSITTTLPDGIHPNLDTYRVLGLELARRITFA